mmetsp:Transcript_1321/g.1436  ORF Transcript_1321/g.1436 Transcript_1321/m.1436 type:complete len:111 (+) Transcript_1321:978-1310(+)
MRTNSSQYYSIRHRYHDNIPKESTTIVLNSDIYFINNRFKNYDSKVTDMKTKYKPRKNSNIEAAKFKNQRLMAKVENVAKCTPTSLSKCHSDSLINKKQHNSFIYSSKNS